MKVFPMTGAAVALAIASAFLFGAALVLTQLVPGIKGSSHDVDDANRL